MSEVISYYNQYDEWGRLEREPIEFQVICFPNLRNALFCKTVCIHKLCLSLNINWLYP